MQLSKGQRLRDKLDTLKKEEGLTDNEVKQLFVKEYLLNEEKNPDELMRDFLHGEQEEE